jgi:hypothetical protein
MIYNDVIGKNRFNIDKSFHSEQTEKIFWKVGKEKVNQCCFKTIGYAKSVSIKSSTTSRLC